MFSKEELIRFADGVDVRGEMYSETRVFVEL